VNQDYQVDEAFLISAFPLPFNPPSTFDGFYLEPRILIRGGVYSSSEHIWAKVQSVQIRHPERDEEVTLGPFEITIDLREALDFKSSDCIRITGEHPHLSSRPCWGNLWSTVKTAVQARDWAGVLNLCYLFLNTYNPDAPYWRLWSDSRCEYCEEFYEDDEMLSCDACDNPVCSNCAEYVHTNDRFGAHLCPVCEDNSDLFCAACEGYIAARQTDLHCSTCDHILHDECALGCASCEAQLCPHCAHQVDCGQDTRAPLCPECYLDTDNLCPECGKFMADSQEVEFCELHNCYVHSFCWKSHLQGDEHVAETKDTAEEEKGPQVSPPPSSSLTTETLEAEALRTGD